MLEINTENGVVQKMSESKTTKQKITDEEIKRNNHCPGGCMNRDKECHNCTHGDKFKPVINFFGKIRKVGSINNPSYVIPLEKRLVNEKKVDIEKGVGVRLTQ